MEERRVAQCGQRLDHPAAGAEQHAALVGDRDFRLRARGEMTLDLLGEVMHVDHRAFDAGFRQPVEHVIDQRACRRPRPAASACVSVSGRMRVPKPAASTMALRGRLAGALGSSGLSRPAHWRDTTRRAAPAPDAPANAADRPIPAACDANIAACRRGGRGGRRCRGSWRRAARPAWHRALAKAGASNSGIGRAPRARIARQQRDLHHLRHVDARVLQQRGEVVGRGPHHRVLEIEQADARDAFAFRQPQQIGRMKIAQHPGRRRRQRRRAARRARARHRRRAWRRHAWRRAAADTSRSAVRLRSASASMS